jgi:hypothetical protein
MKSGYVKACCLHQIISSTLTRKLFIIINSAIAELTTWSLQAKGNT